MSLTVLTLLAIIAQQLMGVSAINVSAPATCQPGWSWMFNSFGQSPCLITAWLYAPCFDWYFYVPESFGTYTPAGHGSDSCTCSTVTFSMITACSLCQGEFAWTWRGWSANCSGPPTLQQYILPIPNETVVPAWAYLPLSNDTFDVNAAKIYNGPESTAPPAPTTVVTISTSTVPPSSTASSTSTSTLSHKSSHAGAIAGGTVAAFVALGVTGVAIATFLSRRRRNQRAPSLEHDAHNDQPTVPQMTQENHHSAYGVGAQAPRRYDPSDPNTYPTFSNLATGHTSRDGLAPSTQYNYVPEI